MWIVITFWAAAFYGYLFGRSVEQKKTEEFRDDAKNVRAEFGRLKNNPAIKEITGRALKIAKEQANGTDKI